MRTANALLTGMAFLAAATLASAENSRVYTLDADFDEGVLFNVNHDAPNNDQLQLNDAGSIQTLPVMYIANAGEDTISKIDTNTNKESARYRTWFNPGTPNSFGTPHSPWAGPAPSRSAVDNDGNGYIANREFRGISPTLIKIFNTGFKDRNGNGVVDTCVDANNNGMVDPTEMCDLRDDNLNGVIDDSEIRDERVAFIVQVGSANALARSVAIAPGGNIWVGYYNSRQYAEYSSATGALISGPFSTGGHTPYGALVDSSNILWGASLSSNILRLDTTTGSNVTIGHGGGNYGIALGRDPISNSVRVYLGSAGSPYLQYHVATGTFSDPSAHPTTCLGLSTDANNDILCGGSTASGGQRGACKLSPGRTGGPASGALIWDRAKQHAGSDQRGCIVDANQDVWTVNRDANSVAKYRGTDGLPLGNFLVGNNPYTYSDATGSGLIQENPTGTWAVVKDAGERGAKDIVISWNALTPNGSSLEVIVDASDTKSSVGDYNPNSATAVTNGGNEAAGLMGRYVYVRARFVSANQVSPILEDLTIRCCPKCGDVNDDCCVDRADFDLVLAEVRARGSNLIYDVNKDGRVTIADARRVVVLYCNPLGAPCAQAQ